MRRMMLRRIVLFAFVLSVLAIRVRRADASEPYLEYIRALQKAGYGELGLKYLEDISKKPDLPSDLKETLALERSKFLRLSAPEAYKEEEKKQREADAKAELETFIKKNPNHPASGAAVIQQADESLEAGARLLAKARASRDKGEQETARKEAREEFGKAKVAFTAAVKQTEQKIKAIPAPPKGTPPTAAQNKLMEQARALEGVWLEARFKIAHCDYFTSQTYTDPKAPERKKAMDDAGKEFDKIFQDYRMSRAGVLAHTWYGKVLAENGKLEDAYDIFDEVLVIVGDGPVPIDDSAIYGMAKLFQCQIVALKKPQEAFNDIDDWLGQRYKESKAWSGTPAFQGMALEWCKLSIQLSEKEKGDAQKKRLKDVLTKLTNIAKVETEYKAEAVMLKRELSQKMGLGGEDPETTGEAEVVGDEAMVNKKYANAVKLYETALEKADKLPNTDKDKADKVRRIRRKLNYSRFSVAREDFEGKRYDECIEKCRAIIKEDKTDPAASGAATLICASLLAKYQAAKEEQDKAKIKADLEKVIKFVLENWAGEPQADDGRMTLARLKLADGDFASATKLLDEVSPQSTKYPDAVSLSGQIYWTLFLKQRKAGGAKPEELAALAKKALERVKQTLEAEQKASSTASQMSEKIFDTQLLVAEIYLETKSYKEAETHFQALLAELAKNKPSKISQEVLRTFHGGVRTEIALGKPVDASKVAMQFLKTTPDDETHNPILVDFVNRVSGEYKNAELRFNEAKTGGKSDEIAKADAELKPAAASFVELLQATTARQKLNPQQILFLADRAGAMALSGEARSLYERVLAMIEKDPAIKAKMGKQELAIRARLVGLLRNENKFKEAKDQVDALIQANPNVIEPLMEKGRILMSWAAREPERYDEAAKHWMFVIKRLGAYKTTPPEFYEAELNTAQCWIHEADRSKSADEKKQKALNAEKLLRASLFSNPTLSGPEKVAEYNSLINKAQRLQNKTPSAAQQPK